MQEEHRFSVLRTEGTSTVWLCSWRIMQTPTSKTKRYTPLDYALLGERHEVIQFMLEHGALSIAAIQDIAAFKIQAVYKGYKVRKAFRDRKNLLMKHEQLRKDAAAKKREEENKRKEAEQQKGQLDTDPPRSHCSSSAPVLPCPPSPQNEASKQDATPSKQPPASHTVQSPDPEHSRPPGRCPGRASQGDSSIDLQGTASRKPSETPIEHCRGPSACVHPRSWEGGNSSKNQGTSSVEKRRGETNGKHRRCEEGPSSARQPLCTGSGRPAEKGEDSSPAVASASQQDHPRKPNKRQDRAARPRGASQKRRTHQLRDRCSPAGSSRPGSAKGEVACADQSSLHRHTPRSKVTQDKLIGGVSSGLPLSTEASRSGCKQLYEDICASPETGVAHGPPPGQCMNIHLLPVEQRLLIIQRERSRKELFRRKNKAAAVIQRAWRSYQLRKHLSRLLHLKQLGAREVLRCTQVCTALLLQVWRKELELKFPKSISVSRTSKSPSKGSSATKYARHSVLRQIYGCSQEGKGHHPIKSSKAPAVLHLSSVNSLQSIHLDNSGRSKKFSYNLQPSSQSKNKPKL